MKQNSFYVDAGVLDILKALSREPASAREVADQISRPLAKVVRDLDRLTRRDLLEVVGEKNGEKVYRPRDASIEATEASLKYIFSALQEGLTEAIHKQGRGTMSMFTARMSEGDVEKIFAKLKELSEEFAGKESPDEGKLVNVFFGAWVE